MGTSIHNKTSALSPKINKSGLNEIQRESKGRITDPRFVTVEKIVIVAALIATASYAAAFTVPGGFNSGDGSKQGTPFLLRKPAFQAFVVTNALAFSFSCIVLLGHIALIVYANRYEEANSLDKQVDVDWFIDHMYYVTKGALFAMTIAFVTGVYVALTPSHGLAIFVCVMTLFLIAYSIFLHDSRRKPPSQQESKTFRSMLLNLR